MAGWREQATALRAVIEKRQKDQAVVSARLPDGDGGLTRQTAFARKIIEEVLIPVLREFSSIVTGVAVQPVQHAYHKQYFGLTCELDSRRFTVDVFLIPEAKVRLAVSLKPSQTLGWHQDFALDATNAEIEEWLGTSLTRLYDAI